MTLLIVGSIAVYLAVGLVSARIWNEYWWPRNNRIVPAEGPAITVLWPLFIAVLVIGLFFVGLSRVLRLVYYPAEARKKIAAEANEVGP